MTRIFNELKKTASSDQKELSLQAHLQLSLCYAAGTTDDDHSSAISHMWIAASGGLEKAQALILRLPRALGDEGPKDSMALFRNSIKRPTVLESVIATADMLRLDHEAYQMVLTERAQTSDGLTLLQACKVGDLVAAEELILQEREIFAYGISGETALHWLGLLPCDHSSRLVALLLEHDLGPDRAIRATTRRTEISECPHFLRTIPSGTTALHWALDCDNEPVFRILLDVVEQKRSSFDMAPLLFTAAQCQSSECLVYLCQKLRQGGKSVDIFDSGGFSALYYAICSDPIEQILRFVPGPGPTRHQPKFRSRKERYLAIIKSLLGGSSAMSVSPDGAFNVVHLAAGLDTPEVLDLVEQHQSLKEPKTQDRSTSQALHFGNNEGGSRDERSGLRGSFLSAKVILVY